MEFVPETDEFGNVLTSRTITIHDPNELPLAELDNDANHIATVHDGTFVTVEEDNSHGREQFHRVIRALDQLNKETGIDPLDFARNVLAIVELYEKDHSEIAIEIKRLLDKADDEMSEEKK